MLLTLDAKMWQRRALVFLLINILIPRIQSLPLFLISSAKARCVTAIAPANTKLVVSYEAPDINFSQREDSFAWISINAKVSKPGTVNNARDLNDHFKRNFNVKSLVAVKEKITEKKAALTYETETDGEVEVCIQASKASSQNPLRFKMSIEEENEMHVHDGANDKEEDETDTESHLSHMELEMRHLLINMRNIVAAANMSKQREILFHQQTLSMHAASMWWPIVQLCVLLLTGFTQANHVVKFLKSKRLI